MPRESRHVREDVASYYDRHGVLSEIREQPVEFALDEELRRQIVRGERTRRLETVSIKLDRAQIQAVRKIATMHSIPYQTLIRQWLAEAIRRELRIGMR
jgi:predicted DNA binding CopG/RHH family protein